MSKHIRITLILAIALCLISFALGRSCGSATTPKENVEVIDSVTTEEEVADTTPIVRDSVVVRYQYVEIPIQRQEQADSIPLTITDQVQVVADGDTASVIIPITQKKYETEDYRAYVSGYSAQLDSIFITRSTTTIRVREPPSPHKRFSIGLQAGYGMTPKGFQPYIGVGVSVNLWKF